MKAVRILIADDHSIVRRGLRTLLEAQPGWRVCGEAADGREAVEKTKQFKPDVVVMDISMPELNGLAATRRILQAGSPVQILILTMHDSPEVIDKVLASGARGYVLKSDADQDLVSAVETLRQGKPFFTSVVSEMMLEGYLKSGGGGKMSRHQGRDRLTLRECEIVQGLAEGKINKEVAAALGIGVRTVESHRAKIMRKLGFKSFSELVRYAVRHKMVGR